MLKRRHGKVPGPGLAGGLQVSGSAWPHAVPCTCGRRCLGFSGLHFPFVRPQCELNYVFKAHTCELNYVFKAHICAGSRDHCCLFVCRNDGRVGRSTGGMDYFHAFDL